MKESAPQKGRIKFPTRRRYRIKTFTLEVVRDPGEHLRHAGSSEEAAWLCRSLIPDDDREHFGILCLNNKNRPIRYHEVSVGSLTSSTVHPREVFKALILAGSAAFICVHNHPSGNPAPSLEDQEITLRLKACADIFSIRFLDHIIIGGGNDCYYSFSDSGTPPFPSLEFHAQSAGKDADRLKLRRSKNHTKIGLDRGNEKRLPFASILES